MFCNRAVSHSALHLQQETSVLQIKTKQIERKSSDGEACPCREHCKLRCHLPGRVEGGIHLYLLSISKENVTQGGLEAARGVQERAACVGGSADRQGTSSLIENAT